MNSDGMKSSLPEDLVEEILMRLPVESLVTFKRVCKSWHALISDRSFANKHLRASTDKGKLSPNATLLYNFRYKEAVRPWERARRLPICYYKDAVLLGSIRSEEDDSLRCALDGPDLIKWRVLVLAHCNGIVCMVKCGLEGNGDIIMCNPVLKEFKCISKPFLKRKCDIVGEGFGYDSRRDDYKFVRIHCFRNISASVTKYKACLYTLGTDSWTDIKLSKRVGKFILHQKGVYCKNVYYWKYISLYNSKDKILAFDLSKEKFRRIRLPFQKEKSRWTQWNTLASWKESVVLFDLIEFSNPFSQFEMWVMDDNVVGVEGGVCWTKHLTIKPLANVTNPLTFWKDNELLIEGLGRVILSYNLDTKKIRTVPIGIIKCIIDYRIEPFVKSLVSIKRGNVLNR